MPKYAVLFNFRGRTLKAMMDKPSDRAAVVRELVESAGGTMEAYYLMFGEYDGLVIYDLRDSASAAAVSLRVRSSDAFSHFETHEILPADQINPILEKASELRYRPPGT
ncbi:MAG: GYD domain-containing protein [Pseudonocardiales bacterium]|nr:GYD domain-containing protein [Pseudonocardiales bacterium]